MQASENPKLRGEKIKMPSLMRKFAPAGLKSYKCAALVTV